MGENIADAVIGDSDDEQLDSASVIIRLKSDFNRLIEDVGKRVVIYIDDLDRLQPVKAIELLEIMKLFVDCVNCVFVMAIDTSVVFSGIREKYGKDMSDAKAQSFFDKMIQMPFRMPVAYYKLYHLTERLLSFLGDSEIVTDPEEKKKLLRLVKTTADGNPRSLKRLVNSIMLLNKVAEKKKLYTEDKLYEMQILISLACLQQRFNACYDHIVGNISMQLVNSLHKVKIPINITKNYSQEFMDNLVSRIGEFPFGEDESKVDFYIVMKYFLDAINGYFNNKNKSLVNENTIFEALVQIISMNNITESTPVAAAESELPRPETDNRNNDAQEPGGNTHECIGSAGTASDDELREPAASYKSLPLLDSDEKDEIIRKINEKGVYFTGVIDYTPPTASVIADVFNKVVSTLGEWYKCDINEVGPAKMYNYYIPESRHEFGIMVGCYPKFIQVNIQLGSSKMPLHTMEIYEPAKELVSIVESESERLEKIFDSCGVPIAADKKIDRGFDDNGHSYYKNDEIKFNLISKPILKAFLKFATKVGTNPELITSNQTV